MGQIYKAFVPISGKNKQLELSFAVTVLKLADHTKGVREKVAAHMRCHAAGDLWGMPAKIDELANESLLAYYESVRRRVTADVQLRREYRLVGESTKHYAAELESEMALRKLHFVPIDWS